MPGSILMTVRACPILGVAQGGGRRSPMQARESTIPLRISGAAMAVAGRESTAGAPGLPEASA